MSGCYRPGSDFSERLQQAEPRSGFGVTTSKRDLGQTSEIPQLPTFLDMPLIGKTFERVRNRWHWPLIFRDSMEIGHEKKI